MEYRFFFLAFLLFCFSCQSDQKKQTVQLADEICKCYLPLLEINNKAQAFLKNNNGKEAEALISEMSLRNTQAKECTLKLTNASENSSSLEAEKLQEAMDENCPAVWPSVKELLFE